MVEQHIGSYFFCLDSVPSRDIVNTVTAVCNWGLLYNSHMIFFCAHLSLFFVQHYLIVRDEFQLVASCDSSCTAECALKIMFPHSTIVVRNVLFPPRTYVGLHQFVISLFSTLVADFA